MENYQKENPNGNKIICQNIRKDCPFCKINVSIEEYEEHILCHELAHNNGNFSNNIIINETQRNNNNNHHQKEKSPQGFDIFKKKVGGIFDSIKNNINNVIDKIDKFDSDNDSDDNNNSNLSQNNNNNSSYNSNNNRNQVFSKVSNFFKKITRSDSEDSGSGEDGPILRLSHFRIRRRNSDLENNSHIDYNINDDNLLLEDLNFLEDENNDNSFKKDDYKEILSYIPTSTVKEIKKSSNNNKCVICLSDFQVGEQESTLPCLHIFHSNCIEKWIIENKTCPICKYDISLNSLLKDTY